MEIIVSKILAGTSLLLSAAVGCSIPFFFTLYRRGRDYDLRRSKSEAALCLCNCLAAGVIMAMSFLHILPESIDMCAYVYLFIRINGNRLNLALPLILVAFTMMLFLERVISFGRTPCCSKFNDCSDNTRCCVSSDEESLVESKAPETAVTSEENISTKGGSRYRHKHSQILSTIKRILCPICDCNGLCMTLALFVHSVFEGLIVGLEDNGVHMWLITLGIVLHKWAAGMALASFMAGNAKSTILVMFGIFCAGSPLGVLIGSLILDSNLVVIAVLNSIAVGTLIYVGFEIIVHELFCEIKCRRTVLYKWLCFVGGIALIFSTLMLEFYLCVHRH